MTSRLNARCFIYITTIFLYTHPLALPTTSLFSNHNCPGAYNPRSSTELLSPLVRNLTVPFSLWTEENTYISRKNPRRLKTNKHYLQSIRSVQAIRPWLVKKCVGSLINNIRTNYFFQDSKSWLFIRIFVFGWSVYFYVSYKLRGLDLSTIRPILFNDKAYCCPKI